eukprot:5335595-Prymnesium_polylepis.1
MMVTDHDHHTTVTKHRFPPRARSSEPSASLAHRHRLLTCYRTRCRPPPDPKHRRPRSEAHAQHSGLTAGRNKRPYTL